MAPSDKGTIASIMYDKVDPKATVTTKSKALSFANVRFPEILTKKIR